MKLNKRVQNAYGSGKAAKSGSDAAGDPEKSPDTTADGSPLKKSAKLNPSAVAALAAGKGLKATPEIHLPRRPHDPSKRIPPRPMDPPAEAGRAHALMPIPVF
jgi:hypothetical protein